MTREGIQSFAVFGVGFNSLELRTACGGCCTKVFVRVNNVRAISGQNFDI